MPVLLWHIKPRWLPLKRSILTNLQNKRGLWTSRRKLTFFSSLLGDNKLLFLNGNNFMQSNSLWKIWRANRLYMPYMAGMAERNLNRGGGASKLAQEMQVCWGRGGGPLTSWAWKWYFQHSQRDISLQKLNLDKVLKKNIFPLEKLPFPPPASKALPSLHGNGQ